MEKKQSEDQVPQEEDVEAFHTLSIEDALEHFETSTNGLSRREAADRLRKYGRNRLSPAYKPGFLRKVWAQVNNILIALLVISAVIAAILQEWADLSLIALVIVVNVVIGMIQEGRAEKSAEALKAMLSASATVVRDGEKIHIDAEEIVPGDIVSLVAGDRVPADIRIISLSGPLACQESMLTGESVPVAKALAPVEAEAPLGDRKCMAFSATLVTAGSGTGVVVATGDNAEVGRISTLVGGVDVTPTHLAVQLEYFGRLIAVATVLLALGSFLIIKLWRNQSTDDAFKATVSIGVAIIPEGLPAVVTVALAIASQHMAVRNAIVRQLAAVETLGSVTVICSDKTGTLTKNEMTVVRVVAPWKDIEVTGVGYDPIGEFIEAKSIKDAMEIGQSRTSIALSKDASVPRLSSSLRPRHKALSSIQESSSIVQDTAPIPAGTFFLPPTSPSATGSFPSMRSPHRTAPSPNVPAVPPITVPGFGDPMEDAAAVPLSSRASRAPNNHAAPAKSFSIETQRSESASVAIEDPTIVAPVAASNAIPPAELQQLLPLIVTGGLCNEGSLQIDPDTNQWKVVGDPTDAAPLVLLKKAGIRPESLEKVFPQVDFVPFDSDYKFAASLHKIPPGFEPQSILPPVEEQNPQGHPSVVSGAMEPINLDLLNSNASGASPSRNAKQEEFHAIPMGEMQPEEARNQAASATSTRNRRTSPSDSTAPLTTSISKRKSGLQGKSKKGGKGTIVQASRPPPQLGNYSSEPQNLSFIHRVILSNSKKANLYSVLMEEDASSDPHVLFIKGAPEALIPLCVDQVPESGGPDRVLCDHALWQKRAAELSSRGLRVIAFAHAYVRGPSHVKEVHQSIPNLTGSGTPKADIPKSGKALTPAQGKVAKKSEETPSDGKPLTIKTPRVATLQQSEQQSTVSTPGTDASTVSNRLTAQAIQEHEPFLTMDCMVAILDPPRDECIGAIAECHRAGIQVKMITGDHPSTALAIAKMLGIVNPLTVPIVHTVTRKTRDGKEITKLKIQPGKSFYKIKADPTLNFATKKKQELREKKRLLDTLEQEKRDELARQISFTHRPMHLAQPIPSASPHVFSQRGSKRIRMPDSKSRMVTASQHETVFVTEGHGDANIVSVPSEKHFAFTEDHDHSDVQSVRSSLHDYTRTGTQHRDRVVTDVSSAQSTVETSDISFTEGDSSSLTVGQGDQQSSRMKRWVRIRSSPGKSTNKISRAMTEAPHSAQGSRRATSGQQDDILRSVSLPQPALGPTPLSLLKMKKTAIPLVDISGITTPTEGGMTPEEEEEEPLVLRGVDVENMTAEELSSVVFSCHVYARASPETKLRILRALQSAGAVTSMTGDGVNDAPALKAADVGCAMGITGTDVAKEASKVVLADDNFASIVEAVKEGRVVWDNLTKVLLVGLPTNFAQGLVVFFAYIVNLSTTPLTAMQVLYVNLLSSVTIGVVLCFEPAEEGVMERLPRSPQTRLLSPFVLYRTFWVCTVLVVIVIGQFYWEQQIGYDDARARTTALNTLVVSQCFYAVNCRFLTHTAFTWKIFRGNNFFWFGILATLALQCLLTYTPGIQDIFGTSFINGLEWLRVFGLAAGLFVLVEIEKVVGPRYIYPLVIPLAKKLEKYIPNISIPEPVAHFLRPWKWACWHRLLKSKAKLKEEDMLKTLDAEMDEDLIEEEKLPIPPSRVPPERQPTFIAFAPSVWGLPSRPPPIAEPVTRIVTGSGRYLILPNAKHVYPTFPLPSELYARDTRTSIRRLRSEGGMLDRRSRHREFQRELEKKWERAKMQTDKVPMLLIPEESGAMSSIDQTALLAREETSMSDAYRTFVERDTIQRAVSCPTVVNPPLSKSPTSHLTASELKQRLQVGAQLSQNISRYQSRLTPVAELPPTLSQEPSDTLQPLPEELSTTSMESLQPGSAILGNGGEFKEHRAAIHSHGAIQPSTEHGPYYGLEAEPLSSSLLRSYGRRSRSFRETPTIPSNLVNPWSLSLYVTRAARGTKKNYGDEE